VDEPDWREAPEPDRSVLREPVPDDPSIGVASTWDSLQSTRYSEPEHHVEPEPVIRPSLRPPVNGQRIDSPTEQIPMVGGGDRATPLERLQRATPLWSDALDAAQRTDREWRTDGAERGAVDDGGPATQASAPFELDELDELELEKRSGHARTGAPDDDLDELDEPAADPDERTREVARPRGRRPAPAQPVDEVDLQPHRRLGRAAAESVGAGWPLVLVQWIAGALGGAALWVGFRFLWRSLPVVALTASVLITIGLIVVVRALLRSKDWRTTGLAVLIGLLLTVSPALLVLLDR
jgi:hypothetical protein